MEARFNDTLELIGESALDNLVQHSAIFWSKYFEFLLTL